MRWRSGRLPSAFASAAILPLLALSLEAQTDPEDIGLWEGPFPLTTQFSGVNTQELAHAVVLPPNVLTSPQARVLFMFVPHYPNECQGGSSCTLPTGQVYGRSYWWTPDRNGRTTLNAIPPPANYPSGSGTGTQDFFCSGHTILPDGRVLVVGGTDYKNTCYEDCGDVFYGHAGAWLLKTVGIGGSGHAVWESSGLAMSKPRWYPSAVSTGIDGNVLVVGHQFLPSVSQVLYRDEYTYSTSSIGSFYSDGRRNYLWNNDAPTCPTQVDAPVGEYARLHLLSNGLLMDSIRAANHGANPAASRFLDVAFQDFWSCGSEGTHDSNKNLWRWKPGDTPYVSHWNGSSVHLIGWHDSGEEGSGLQVPADFTEVVYVVGGAIAGIDAIDCLDVEGESSHPYVAKMVFPDDEAEWVGTYFMNYPRVYHNTVILADGSLLAVGGVTAVDNHCSAQLTPERFEPPEVIASTEFVWDELASQEQKRGYHSIACLLPDGTVVSGGGDDKEDQDLNSEQSVEVFHPPYCYPESDRPDVVTSGIDPATTKDYEQEVEFDVRLKDSNTSVERVALLRPSSVTHGADMDQRYVELALSEPPQQVGTRMQHVTVQMPLDEFYAPPGYYMLFVVDSHGKVGHAVWIQLLQL